MLNLQSQAGAILLQVKVVPNASRSGIAGLLGDQLKIKVAQPPEDGRANRAVESLLAECLGVPPSQVEVVSGHTRPRKTVRIRGMALEAAQAALLAAAGHAGKPVDPTP